MKKYSWTSGLVLWLMCGGMVWAGTHARQNGKQAASQPSSNMASHTAMHTMMKNCRSSMNHINGRLKNLAQAANRAAASPSKLRMKTELGKISTELNSLRSNMQTCRSNMHMVRKIMKTKP